MDSFKGDFIRDSDDGSNVYRSVLDFLVWFKVSNELNLKLTLKPTFDVSDSSVPEILSNWQTNGLVVTDMFGVFVMIFVDGCFAMYYLIDMKRSLANYNKLLQRFAFINATLQVQEKDLNHVGKTRLKFLAVMAILM